MPSNVLEADKTTPYSSVELYSFDPLMSGVNANEALAKILGSIDLSLYPKVFLEAFASRTMHLDGPKTEDRYADALDTFDPSRILLNALTFLSVPAPSETIQYKAKLPSQLISKRFALNYQNRLANFLNDEKPKNWSDIVSETISSLKDITIRRLDSVSQSTVLPADWDVRWDGVGKTLDTKIFGAKFKHILKYLGSASAIGLMHHYRQHFYYGELVEGPIELIRSLAPNEELEIITTETTTKTTEETTESENEVTTSTSREMKDSSDLSTRVSQSLMDSTTSVVQAEGSYNALVWNAGGSGSNTVTTSSQSTSESATKKLSEITSKQAEQIRKKTRITTQTSSSTTNASTNRQVIKNSSNAPLSYGLKRLGYQVKTKVQDLGPQLVWQTKVKNPGKYLARPYLANLAIIPATFGTTHKFLTVTLESVPQLQSATEAVFSVGKSLIEAFENEWSKLDTIPSIRTAKEYEECYQSFYKNQPYKKPILQGHQLLSDKGGSGGSIWVNESEKLVVELSTTLINGEIYICRFQAARFPKATITFRVDIDNWPVIATASYIPESILPAAVIKDNPPSKDLLTHLTSLIETKYVMSHSATSDSSSSHRDSGGLRFEERKTILAHILVNVCTSFYNQDGVNDAVFELYLRVIDIFELRQLFFDIDTSEWNEAGFLQSSKSGGRPAYAIHSDATGEVPPGASLGWNHQLDGDFHRDSFINAPFAWACLPVKTGKEKAAMAFFEEQGLVTPGIDANEKLLKELRALRVAERLFGSDAAFKLAHKGHPIVTPAAEIRNWLNSEYLKNASIDDVESITSPSEFASLMSMTNGAADVYPTVSAAETFVTIEGAAFEALVGKSVVAEPNERVKEYFGGQRTQVLILIVIALQAILLIALLANRT